MFQNVIEKDNKLNIFSNVFAVKNVVLYVISFMLSMVNIGGEFSIFSISMLGACFTSSVPLLRNSANINGRKLNKIWSRRFIGIFLNSISFSSKFIHN